MAGEGAVEIDFYASGTDGENGSGAVAEGDPESGVGVDFLFVEFPVAVGLDEFGIPYACGFLAGDCDFGELSVSAASTAFSRAGKRVLEPEMWYIGS